MPDRAWTRRTFLRTTAGVGACVTAGVCYPSERWLAYLPGAAQPGGATADSLAALIRVAPTARYWVAASPAEGRSDCSACHQPGERSAEAEPAHERAWVRCRLCARNCLLDDGERGLCRARINVGGELKTLVYGRPLSVHVDPIEKKPFYHFLPGSQAFSLSTSGCPLRCKFCQNWEISQATPESYASTVVPPAAIAGAAARRGAPVIAFTYNEPTVFTEYLTDIARAAREQERRSVLVSCGYMNEAPLAEMCEVLDAIKIDLKGFADAFYRKVCEAELRPVLRSIEQIGASGVHLELVNLVVPTLNDSPQMLTELSKWVVGQLGPDVPVHFTRFHPDYQLPNLPPTPVATLERARDLALAQGMHYPFVGNVPGHPGNNTYCPGCGAVVIERIGFFVKSLRLREGRCAACGTEIRGVWS